MNFENAIRGLRNPMNSWEKSDSWGGVSTVEEDYHLQDVAKRWMYNQTKQYDEVLLEKYMAWLCNQGILNQNKDGIYVFYFGPKDLNLAQRMIKAGTSDRKFLRQIFVSVDITAPLYWWKEFDTYKIGTTANSTSTMHKIKDIIIDQDCFELDDFDGDLCLLDHVPIGLRVAQFVEDLEQLRQKYLITKDKRYWKELIRWLPEGWLQTRTVTMNYENLINIYSQRKNHRLTEWHKFCDWVKTLPYAYELIIFSIDNK